MKKINPYIYLSISLIFIVVVSFFYKSNATNQLENFDAKLVKIEYYKSSSDTNAPVNVRLFFRVKHPQPQRLQLQLAYPDHITYNSPVKYIDKLGNLVYTFALPKNSKSVFMAGFFDSASQQFSHPLSVEAIPSQHNILAKKLPPLIQID